MKSLGLSIDHKASCNLKHGGKKFSKCEARNQPLSGDPLLASAINFWDNFNSSFGTSYTSIVIFFISRYNSEKLCLTKERQQTLFCKQTSQAM